MPCFLDYDSPTALKKFLDDNSFAMQKKFGQNFLINRSCREKLLSALKTEPNMSVWEIGPGLGAMTESLLSKGTKLTAFEIDYGFSKALTTMFSDFDNFNLIEGDVLKTWSDTAKSTGKPDRLFGNLPYNIAATILAQFITSGMIFDVCVVTIQKEVAMRMIASPSTKDYSSFTVLCQWAYDITTIMDIAPGSFWPKPNVASRAVRLTRKKQPLQCTNNAVFFSLIRGLFASRRKTIYNNIRTWLSTNGYERENNNTEKIALEVLSKAGIDKMVRAEALELKDFIVLSNMVADYEYT